MHINMEHMYILNIVDVKIYYTYSRPNYIELCHIKSHVHHLQLKLSRPFKFTMHEVEMWCFLPICLTIVRPKFDHTHRFCEVAMADLLDFVPKIFPIFVFVCQCD